MADTPLTITRNLVDVLDALSAQQERLSAVVAGLNSIVSKMEESHAQLAKDRDYLIKVLHDNEHGGIVVSVASLKLATESLSDQVSEIKAARVQTGRTAWQAAIAVIISAIGALISSATSLMNIHRR